MEGVGIDQEAAIDGGRQGEFLVAVVERLDVEEATAARFEGELANRNERLEEAQRRAEERRLAMMAEKMARLEAQAQRAWEKSEEMWQARVRVTQRDTDRVAEIDAETCIGCYKCMVACHDGAHQCIFPPEGGGRVPVVDLDECVGCNLCQIVCPVPDCISMVEVDNGYKPVTWNEHVNDGATLRPKKGVH